MQYVVSTCAANLAYVGSTGCRNAVVLGLHHGNSQALLDSSAALGVTVEHVGNLDKYLVHGFHPVIVVMP